MQGMIKEKRKKSTAISAFDPVGDALGLSHIHVGGTTEPQVVNCGVVFLFFANPIGHVTKMEQL